MDTTLTHIRLSTIIMFAIILLESLVGFSLLYAGVMYREYDEDAANETLAAIQEADPNYHALLNDPGQPEFMEEFRRLNTTTGNSTFVAGGIILIVFSILMLIPALMIFLAAAPADDGEAAKTDNEKQRQREDEDTF